MIINEGNPVTGENMKIVRMYLLAILAYTFGASDSLSHWRPTDLLASLIVLSLIIGWFTVGVKQ